LCLTLFCSNQPWDDLSAPVIITFCQVTSFLHSTLFAVALGFFYSPWEDLHLATWAAFTFTTSPNISVEVGQPVAATATTQVKLCIYDKEELVILFCLNKAQFAAAGIKLQNKAQVCQYTCQSAKASPLGCSGNSRCLQ
jgi:hypothetical protein